MNIVGYESDEDDAILSTVSTSTTAVTNQGSIHEADSIEEASSGSKRLKQDDNSGGDEQDNDSEKPNEFLKLCNLVTTSNGAFSFAKSCTSAKFFNLPDLVDKLAEKQCLSSSATQLSNSVFRVHWNGQHPGQTIAAKSDKKLGGV